MKKLYRSRKNRVFTGLLGGIGEYFNVDPVLIRFVYVTILIFSHVWPGLIIYGIGYLLIPEAPDTEIIAGDKVEE